MISKQNTIHSLIIATAVTTNLKNIQEGNLRGTLKDKIHLEDFCYNYQQYNMHKTIQLSEESAEKVKESSVHLIRNDPQKNQPNQEVKTKNQNEISKNDAKGKVEKSDENNEEDLLETKEQKEQKSEKTSSNEESEESIDDDFSSEEKSFQYLHEGLSKGPLMPPRNDKRKEEEAKFFKAIEKNDENIEKLFKNEISKNYLLEKITTKEFLDRRDYILRQITPKELEKIMKELFNSEKNDKVNQFIEEVCDFGKRDFSAFYFSITKENQETNFRKKINEIFEGFYELSGRWQLYYDVEFKKNSQKFLDSIRNSQLGHYPAQNVLDVDVKKLARDIIMLAIDKPNSKSPLDFLNEEFQQKKLNLVFYMPSFSDVPKPNSENQTNETQNNSIQQKNHKESLKCIPLDKRNDIKQALESKVKSRIQDMFDQSQKNDNCIIFLTGHGKNNNFIINDKVSAFLSLDDIIQLWDDRKTKSNNQLLIVVDACFLGKWTADLRWDPKYKNITDISIQTSSNQYQESRDTGPESGGCFLNNFLYLNGMRDLVYNYNYKTVDDSTGKIIDDQTPTFFTRLNDIESVFRLKVGFDNWNDIERKVKTQFKGIYTDENGDVYRGQFKSILLHGEGSKQLKCGREERGHFKNDTLDGFGTLKFKDMTCEGFFENGRPTDNYSAKLSNGEMLPDPELIDGVPINRLVIDNNMFKEIRRINPVDNCPYEWIKEVYNDLTTIEGECREGKRHGFNYIHDGSKYTKVGIWQHNEFVEGLISDENGKLRPVKVDLVKKHLNKMSFLNEEEFITVGSDCFSTEDIQIKSTTIFDENQFWFDWMPKNNLTGVYEKSDMVFIGKLNHRSNEPPTGYGIFKQTGGIYYKGNWVDGLPDGHGKMYSEKGDWTYSGIWKKGKRNGQGKMIINNVINYEGNWQFDTAIGFGKYSELAGIFDGFIILNNTMKVKRNSHVFGFNGAFKFSNTLKTYKDTFWKKTMERTDPEFLEMYVDMGNSKNQHPQKNMFSEHMTRLKENFPLPEDFVGTYWHSDIYGLCSFKSHINQKVVGEFYQNGLLLRNSSILKNELGYEGDILVDNVSNDPNSINYKKLTLESIEEYLYWIRKHGYGKQKIFDKQKTKEILFDGLFHLDNELTGMKMTINSKEKLNNNELQKWIQNENDTTITYQLNGMLDSQTWLTRSKIQFPDKSLYDGLIVVHKGIYQTSPRDDYLPYSHFIQNPDLFNINESHLSLYGYGIHEIKNTNKRVRYSGWFVDNQRQGKGILDTPDLKYEGEFLNNCFSGKGTLINKLRGTEYFGDMLMNLRHGEGRLKQWDVTKSTSEKIIHNDRESLVRVYDGEYKGGFENDLYSGYGELITIHREDIKNIRFVEEGNGGTSDEFNFYLTGTFRFTISQPNEKVLTGRLTYTKFKQRIERPYDKFNSKMVFKFDDYTSCVFTFIEERIQVHYLDSSKFGLYQDDQLSLNPTYLLSGTMGMLFPDQIYEFDNVSSVFPKNISVDSSVRLNIERKDIENRMIYSCEKINQSELLHDHEKAKQVEKIFFFIGDNNEMYTVVWKKNEDTNKRDSISITKTAREFYKGSFRNGMKSGHGQITKIDGSKYDGEFFDDKYHGHGKLISPLNVVYEGQFKEGFMDGSGEIKYPNDISYKGEFKHNVPHGFGKFNVRDFRSEFLSYHGNVKNGKISGAGKLTYLYEKHPDRNNLLATSFPKYLTLGSRQLSTYSYEGSFRNGVFHGEGISSKEKVSINGFLNHYNNKVIVPNYTSPMRNGIVVTGTGVFRYSELDSFKRCLGHNIFEDEIIGSLDDDRYMIFNRQSKINSIFAKQKEIENDNALFDYFTGQCEIKYSTVHPPVEVEMAYGCIISHGVIDRHDNSRYNGHILLKMKQPEIEFTCIDYVIEFLTTRSFHSDLHFHMIHGHGVTIDKNKVAIKETINKGKVKRNETTDKGKVEIGEYSCGHFRKGIQITNHNDVFIGSFENGTLTGIGQKFFRNGDAYYGEFNEGRYEGKGLLMKNDQLYYGDFKNERFDGNGLYVSSNDHKPLNQYSLTFDHKSVSENSFSNQRMSFAQHLSLVNHTYVGQWNRDLKHGRGHVSFDNRSSYLGTFKTNQIEGYGKFTIDSSGEIREGQFMKGMMNGHGRRTIGNNHAYVGLFENDEYTYYGELKTDKIEYKGNFDRGEFDGRGLLDNGKLVYNGYFQKGLKEGSAKLLLGKYEYGKQRLILANFINDRIQTQAYFEDSLIKKFISFENKKIIRDFKISDPFGVQMEYKILKCLSEMWDRKIITSDFDNIFHGNFIVKTPELIFFDLIFNYGNCETKFDIFNCSAHRLNELDLINKKLFLKFNPNTKEKEVLKEIVHQIEKQTAKGSIEIMNMFYDNFRYNYELLKQNKIELFENIFDKCRDIRDSEALENILLSVYQDKLPGLAYQHSMLISSSNGYIKLLNDEVHNIQEYDGTFKGGMWDEGTVIYKNGDNLNGKFKNFQIKGKGRKIFNNGCRYYGTFKDYRMDGFGELTFSNQIIYEGEFRNDQMHNSGVLKIPIRKKKGYVIIPVQMVNGLIIHYAKHKKLSSGELYSGQCLMKLKTVTGYRDEETFNDLLEFVDIYGEGVLTKPDENHTLESEITKEIKLIEFVNPDGLKVQKIEYPNMKLETIKEFHENGVICTQVKEDAEIKFTMVKYPSDYWHVFSVPTERQIGHRVMNLSGIRVDVFLSEDEEWI